MPYRGSMESSTHQSEIIPQFSRQSRPFADNQAHSERRSFEIFQELGGFGGSERILDSGCGPGLVSCYLAARAGEVVGVDLTPAMVSLATERAAAQGLKNVRFVQGDMTRLPFAGRHFDAAVTRYAFHHLEDPAGAFAELTRVTRLGGCVILVDVSPPEAKRGAYDAFEKMRDPSHTRALTGREIRELGRGWAMGDPEVRHFGLPMNAEALVQSSFPEACSREELLASLEADCRRDEIGLGACREEGTLYVTFPITAAKWRLPEMA